MRCAAYSTVTNQWAAIFLDISWVWLTLQPFSALHAHTGDPAQARSAIQHFYDKLLHIRDRLKTTHGKLLGASRHQMVRLFITKLSYLWFIDIFQLLDFLGAVEDEYDVRMPSLVAK